MNYRSNSPNKGGLSGWESNQDLAYRVNSLGPRNLAIACEKIDTKLVHISIDYVFESKGIVPYREYDVTNPVSVYGKTIMRSAKEKGHLEVEGGLVSIYEKYFNLGDKNEDFRCK